MSFTYRQVDPAIFSDGEELTGSPIYSGHGEGLNNPAMEAVHNVGPIPAGRWHIQSWQDNYENKGSVVAILLPVGHDAHGRSGFLIHGPHADDHFDSSDGCIIAPHSVRQQMRDNGSSDLLVVMDTDNEDSESPAVA